MDSFKRHFDGSIEIHRISAVDAMIKRILTDSDLISNEEKACYKSHAKAIECSLQSNSHSLILEDDVIFSSRTQQALNSILNSRLMDGLDICFAELGLENMTQYPSLYALKNKLFLQNKVSMIDLAGYRFHGSTAYVVNKNSKNKLLNLLKDKSSYTQPYDEDLSSWVREGKIKAKCILPFPVNLNPIEFVSDIRDDKANLYTNTRLGIRRMLGLDCDHTKPENEKIIKFYEVYFYAHHDKFLKLLKPNLLYKGCRIQVTNATS
jgi:GR25 family glycosyltransferase involved in LPS biosynthesis